MEDGKHRKTRVTDIIQRITGEEKAIRH